MEPTNLEIFVLAIACMPAVYYGIRFLFFILRQTFKYWSHSDSKYGCSTSMQYGWWD